MDDAARLIPEHIQANYAQLVAERYGGDWSKLARQAETDGEHIIAAWAASHTDATAPVETAVDKTPRTRRGGGTG